MRYSPSLPRQIIAEDGETLASYLLRLCSSVGISWHQLLAQLHITRGMAKPLPNRRLLVGQDFFPRLSGFTGDSPEFYLDLLTHFGPSPDRTIRPDRTEERSYWSGFSGLCSGCVEQSNHIVTLEHLAFFHFYCFHHQEWTGDPLIQLLIDSGGGAVYIAAARRLRQISDIDPDLCHAAWIVGSTALGRCRIERGSIALNSLWDYRSELIEMRANSRSEAPFFPEIVGLAELLADPFSFEIIKREIDDWDEELLLGLEETLVADIEAPPKSGHLARYVGMSLRRQALLYRLDEGAGAVTKYFRSGSELVEHEWYLGLLPTTSPVPAGVR